MSLEKNEIYNKLEQMFFADEFKKVVSLAELYTAEDKKDTELFSMKARAHLMLGQYDEAEDAANKILFLDASSGEPYFYYGMIEKAKKNYEKAVTDFKASISYGYDRIVNNRNMAICYEAQNKYTEAIKCYEAIRKLDERDVHNRVRYARVLLSLGIYDRAVQVLDEIIILEPGMESAHAFKADALLAMGESQKAEETCRKSLKIFKDSMHLKASLISALNVQENYEEAESVIKEALKSHPDNEGFKVAEAGLYMQQGRREEAMEIYAGLLESENDYIASEASYNMMTGALVSAEYDNVMKYADLVIAKDGIRQYTGAGYYFKAYGQSMLDDSKAKEYYEAAQKAYKDDSLGDLDRFGLYRVLCSIALKNFDTAEMLIKQNAIINGDEEMQAVMKYSLHNAKGEDEEAKKYYDVIASSQLAAAVAMKQK